MNATLAFKAFKLDEAVPQAKDSGFLSFMINFAFYSSIVGQGCAVLGCLISCCCLIIGGGAALAGLKEKMGRGSGDDQFGRKLKKIFFITNSLQFMDMMHF
jgi:hypothetical protein